MKRNQLSSRVDISKDGILIANEIVDGWKKAGESGIVLKLDFEKAFDSVN